MSRKKPEFVHYHEKQKIATGKNSELLFFPSLVVVVDGIQLSHDHKLL